MGDFLHRTTKVYLTSQSPNKLPEPVANYIEDPDLSAVVGYPSIYWIITGDVVTLMDASARAAVDAQMLSDARDSIIAEVDAVESILRQIVVLLVSELNILRAQHGLADRTLAQVKQQLRDSLGS